MKNMKLTFAGIASAAAFGLWGGRAGAQRRARIGFDARPDALYGGLRASGHGMALGIPGSDQEYLAKTLLDNFALI